MSDALDLFLELAAIASPPGKEREVADRVRGYLRDLGLEVFEDAPPADGDQAGNIFTRLTPTAPGIPVLLCAHIDTVPPTAGLEPVVEDGIVRNAQGTILGGDNKAAVASMLDAVRQIVQQNLPHAGIELVITVQEEVGLIGAKAFDVRRLNAKVGFVYDHADSVGKIVTTAPSQYTIRATFTGKAAHSGIAPEEGRSAVVAAAKAIAELDLGRIDRETTANVGLIEGGVAPNIIPEHCTLSAEARSLDHDRALAQTQAMLDTMAHAANAAECELTTTVTLEYRAYKLRRGEPVVEIASRALEAAGFVPELISSGGGADSHVFVAAGIPCVNLCNGMRMIHTSDEHIAVADIDGMTRVTLELVAAAAQMAS